MFQKGNPGKPKGAKSKVAKKIDELCKEYNIDLIRCYFEILSGSKTSCFSRIDPNSITIKELLHCLNKLTDMRYGRPRQAAEVEINAPKSFSEMWADTMLEMQLDEMQEDDKSENQE